MEHIVNFDGYCFSCAHKNTDENGDPCNDCLTAPVREDSRKPECYESDGVDYGFGYYRNIRKIAPYLYSVLYNNIDYDYAMAYFDKDKDIDVPIGMCSAVRSGNLYGRNFDWYYSNQAEFVVRTYPAPHRYATIGIAGGFSKLTDEYVNSKAKDDLYYVLPFMLQDGMNSAGVVMSINVVPADYGHNTAEPTGTKHNEISALMLIRFVLDNFGTAKTAADYIRKHLCVYFPKSLHAKNYEAHFMLADRTSTYAIEFINNRTVVIDITNKPWMTNFHLHGVRFCGDGQVYTPQFSNGELNPVAYNHITEHGSGLERYNYICDKYSQLQRFGGVVHSMMSLLEDLSYTRAYQSSGSPSDPYWYSEFVDGNLILTSDMSEFERVAGIAAEMYSRRDRNTPNTWHTMHSSIYSRNSMKLYLRVQETPDQMLEFAL